MQAKEWTFDRPWHVKEGPWDNEPDKAQWEHDGFACLAVRNRSGAWCGYVGVPEGHPWHGRHWGDDATFYELDVHGGVTFTAACAGDPDGHSICHLTEPGDPDPLWWVGFDCNHAGDNAPAYATDELLAEYGSYKPLSYVKAECASLVDQAKAAK